MESYYLVFSFNDLNKFIKTNIPKYSLFKYFNESFFKRNIKKNNIFIICLVYGELVGVLSLKKKEDHFLTKDKGLSIWNIYYIDVRKDYRNKGIASGLYKKLNNWVTSDMVIVGTIEEGIGELIGIHNLRNKIITRCKNYNLIDDLYIDLYGNEA